jgi:glycosyltransferase involved in cell wall biosynthesis
MILPFVSVIVITKNNAKTIEDCIVSLMNQTYPKENYELIFVDGQSIDGTDVVIKKHMRTSQLLKLFYENYGTMGYARNLGVRESKGDIVAFTDGDAVLPQDWIEQIVNVFKHDVKLIAIGGFDRLVSSPETTRIIDSWRRLKRVIGIKAIPCIKTVNFAIKRETIISCGGFDQRLSHWDETELLARLYEKTKNGNILYDPNLVVYHRREQTSNITDRVKKRTHMFFRKSLIGTSVLMKRYMMRVAIANPLSPLATSFYMILACIIGLPILIFSVVTGFFMNILLACLLLYMVALSVFMIKMFLRTRKVVLAVPLILTVDSIVRFAGTFLGLMKWFGSIFIESKDNEAVTSERI